MYTQKLTIRLTPYQLQVLTELSNKFGSSYSLLVRTIIGDWLTKNDEILEKIIDNKTAKTLDDAIHQQTPEEE